MLCRRSAVPLRVALILAPVVTSFPAARADTPPLTAEVRSKVAAEYPSLESLYKHLHTHPELSLHEEQSAARMAKELKDLGFSVTEHVGGHGVVGILKNGDGPTILIRTDMDALPVIERTGLPYASKVLTRDKDGNEVGIMHACGHDIHMTVWTGTARVLAGMKDRWKGTLIFIGQPAEEAGAASARMMLEGGLFKNFLARTTPWPYTATASDRTAQLRSPKGWRWPTSIPWTSSSKARAATARRRTRPSTRSFWRHASSSTYRRSSVAKLTRLTRPW